MPFKLPGNLLGTVSALPSKPHLVHRNKVMGGSAILQCCELCSQSCCLHRDPLLAEFFFVWPLQQTLLQYQFHLPTEYAWGGQRRATEAQLVHRNTVTGRIWPKCSGLSFAVRAAGRTETGVCLGPFSCGLCNRHRCSISLILYSQ